MPLYEYQCEACGKRFEVIQKFSDPVLETCRLCAAGPVRRLLSSPAIQFKGSGWYITDYSQKGKEPAKSGGESAGSDAAGKAEASKTEASKADAAPTGAARIETKSESSSTSNTSSPAKSSEKQ